MVRGISTVPLDSHFQRADGSRTRGHSWKLMKSHSRCDARLYFSARVVNRSNSLPQEAVEVTTVNSFKSHLEKIRRKQMDFFMDTSPRNPHGCMDTNGLHRDDLLQLVNQWCSRTR